MDAGGAFKVTRGFDFTDHFSNPTGAASLVISGTGHNVRRRVVRLHCAAVCCCLTRRDCGRHDWQPQSNTESRKYIKKKTFSRADYGNNNHHRLSSEK